MITLFFTLYFLAATVMYSYTRIRYPSSLDYYGSEKDIFLSEKRFFATTFWPISLLFFLVFFPLSNVSYLFMNKRIENKIEKNKARISEMNRIRVELEDSNRQLKEAEEEVEAELKAHK